MNFTELRETFTNPDVEFRPVPFWFWNSKLDPDEIERQVLLMYEAGLGGFFMHARFGLESEYMGENWMNCIRRAIQTAHQCGIKAWLYDEYPFPSGVGGLKVTQNPEYCNKFIDLVEAKFVGPKEISLPIPEKPLIAYAVRTDQISDFYEKAVIINSSNEKEFCWNVPEGEWLVMIFVKRVLQDPRGNVFGPDYLNPLMTKAFLSVLDTYVNDEEIKKYLGETVPGIFTDEPCLLAWHQNHTNYPTRPDGRIVAWGDEVPERLEKKDYDWLKVLPALFYDVSIDSAELRHTYREVVAKNYIDSFFMPYQQWCHKNNLKLTGHLLLEEGLYTNTIFQGDFIRDLSLFDIPGSDHLGIGCEGKYGGWGNLPLMSTNIQGQKLVSSIAHIYNKEAVLSESFGVSGWGLSIADMKRIVDWQYRLGINFLCPHAFYYSMEGFRKYDSPPSQFFQATYWRYYRYFADYVARLSLLMRAGRHVAQAALFYPQDDFWKAFKAGKEDKQDRRLEDQFDFYASQLPKCHVDYDIIPEQFITVDTVKDGKLEIGQEQYELIILPAVSDYSSPLLDALISFYQEGGKLLLTSPVADGLINKLKSVPSPKGVLNILDEIQPEALKNALSKLIIPDVRISHREVTCIHRELSGKHIYFFASDSNGSLKVKLEMNGIGFVEQWDIETGQMRSISSEITDDGYTSVKWDFSPYGSLALVLDTERKAKPEQVKAINWHCIPLDDVWDFSCDSPNALPLDHWNIQLTTQGDWLHYDYTTNVQIMDVPESILLLLDDVESRGSFMAGMQFQIFVNGHKIPHESTGYYIDSKWKTFNITERLNQGGNRIHIRFTNQSWAGEPKAMMIPPKLLGNFALLKNTNGKYVISSPAPQIKSGISWTEQGYPFYSGTATYSQQVNLDDLHGQVCLEATGVADMAEFIVNGVCASVRPWAPYRCEVSSLLRLGQNNIMIKVTNSMKNFLECDAKPSGLLGLTRLTTCANYRKLRNKASL
jgi:hypothetical protein